MRHRPGPWRADHRPASSAVELALLLPLLALFFLVTVDFARLYYHYSIVTNCARNGALYWALYGNSPLLAKESPYYNVNPNQAITNAALADASNLNPQPAVNSDYGIDSAGNQYVDVTVVYPFTTISNYPGLSNPLNVGRTVRMRVAPVTPN